MLTFVILAYFGTPQDLIRNPTPLNILKKLREATPTPGQNMSPPIELMDALEEAVRKDSANRVNRKAPALELEAKNQLIFQSEPILPPERKRDGRWHFDTIRFDVVPSHLFIYGLRFQGNHTVRLRKVTLIFRDGGSEVFDDWLEMEGGNGKEFSRHDWVGPLEVWGEGRPRRARRLAAIEILGSAQDDDHESALSFMFSLPDPDARSSNEALNQVSWLRRHWPQEPADASRIQRWRDGLDRLETLLSNH